MYAKLLLQTVIFRNLVFKIKSRNGHDYRCHKKILWLINLLFYVYTLPFKNLIQSFNKINHFCHMIESNFI